MVTANVRHERGITMRNLTLLILAVLVGTGCGERTQSEQTYASPKQAPSFKQPLVFGFDLIFSNGADPAQAPYSLVCRLAADVGTDRNAFDTLVRREREFIAIAESRLDDHEALDRPGGYKAAMDDIRDRFDRLMETGTPVRAVYAYELSKAPKP